MLTARLQQDEGTLQAGRITRAMELRDASLARTVELPQADPDDMEVILSDGFITDDYNLIGPLYEMDGEIFQLDISRNRGAFLYRYGDAFAINFNPDTDTNHSRIQPFENRPNPDQITGFTTRWHRRGYNGAVLDNNVILTHSAYYPQTTNDFAWDEFVALRVDPATRTARFEYPQRPLGAQSTNFHISADGPESQIVALDGATVAVAGRSNQAGGFRPNIWLVEYDDATGDMTGHGPFPIGGLAAVGDNDSQNGEIFLVNMTGNRLLAVWHGTFQFDNGDMSGDELKRFRPLYAQVLDYDLGAMTVTATGPMRVFKSGVSGEETGVVWYPDAELLVLTGLNYTTTNDRGDGSVAYPGYPAGLDYHVAARSLKVAGYDITERTTWVRLGTADNTLLDFDSYFYVHSLHGAGDRLMVVWADIDDALGGDLKYTKFKVGLAGAGMGSLTPYQTGVLIANAATQDSYEHWPHQSGTVFQTPISATENLSCFEHYIELYNRWIVWFVLCREPS